MTPLALFKLAWRSIWRHKRRTAITAFSVALGLGLAIFFTSLNEGVYFQMTNDAVRMQAGHVTVEHALYREAPAIDLYVENVTSLREKIAQLEGVERTKLLINGQGVARSALSAVGVGIMGVEPGAETKGSSPIARKMVAGSYLEEGDGRRVVIGKRLAERLGLDVGKKLVLSSNDTNGDIVEELYRVKGIFEMGADEIDGYFLQAPIGAIRGLYTMPADSATQLGVIIKDPDNEKAMLAAVKEVVAGVTDAGSLRALPWEEVLPELANYIRVDRQSGLIFMRLLLFLILFTIFNTILMSVLEREREFAVLLALGTRPAQINWQILLETALIALLGCAVGIAGGWAWGHHIQVHGWDFSSLYEEGLSISGFAVDTKLYARVTAKKIIDLTSEVFIVTLLLCLLPIRRTGKISVTDTLR